MRGTDPADELFVHEGPWTYAVDVTGGHKTGFYLDQRDARTAIAGLATDRRVLNVFAYTGAFSVLAAGNGATSVTSIDSSGPALATAARNGELNHVDVGELMEADAFTALRGLRDRAKQYDLIALDPPKLAANDKQVDKATRAYKDLNLLAIKLLAPGGTLMTFSCSGAMSADLFQKVVAGAALDAGRTVRIKGRLGQPSDHPVPLSFPEAEYLKGLILEADIDQWHFSTIENGRVSAMSRGAIVTIDRAGRIVVPKALRDRLHLEPGQSLRAHVRDGRLELEPEPVDARLVEVDGLLVITPDEPVPALTRDGVRDLMEELRR